MTSAKKRVVVVNFKKITSEAAVRLSEKLNDLEEPALNCFQIVLCVQMQDALAVCKSCKFGVFGLVSSPDFQADEGFDRLALVDAPNFGGVVMNHPEHRLSEDVLDRYVGQIREAGLGIIACCGSISEATTLCKYRPDFIGLKINEIIGKDISFSTYCPQVLLDAVSKLPANILIGGGIRSSRDLEFVIKNGGAGVLVSSVIVNSNQPAEALCSLLNV